MFLKLIINESAAFLNRFYVENFHQLTKGFYFLVAIDYVRLKSGLSQA
jgi:hypothetical protein